MTGRTTRAASTTMQSTAITSEPAHSTDETGEPVHSTSETVKTEQTDEQPISTTAQSTASEGSTNGDEITMTDSTAVESSSIVTSEREPNTTIQISDKTTSNIQTSYGPSSIAQNTDGFTTVQTSTKYSTASEATSELKPTTNSDVSTTMYSTQSDTSTNKLTTSVSSAEETDATQPLTSEATLSSAAPDFYTVSEATLFTGSSSSQSTDDTVYSTKPETTATVSGFTRGMPSEETSDSSHSSTESSTTSVIPTTTSTNPSCTCENCILEDPEDCTKYLECENSQYTPKQCDIGFLYSSVLERCEIADKVKCNHISEQCSSADGFFADQNNCTSYVQCYHGIAYKKSCPDGLLYNLSKRTCDIKSNCGAEAVLPSSRDLDIECDCNHCIMGDSDDCSKYYLCLDGNAYNETCSEGLLFNPKISTCDYESSVSCAKSSPQCTAKNGNFPSPASCSQYFHCVGGVAYDRECSPGFHFGATSEKCEEACKAGCDPTLECPTTTAPPLCLNTFDLHPNPDDCHTFYECSEGIPKLAECVGDEHFSPVEQSCLDPCMAMCDLTLDCFNTSTSVIPTDHETSEITSEVPTLTGKTGISSTSQPSEGTSSGISNLPSISDEPSTPETHEQTSDYYISTDEDDILTTRLYTSSSSESDYSTRQKTESTSDTITSEETLRSTSVSDGTELTSIDLYSPGTFPEGSSDHWVTESKLVPTTSESSRTSRQFTSSSLLLSTSESTEQTVPITESGLCEDPNGVYPNPTDCRGLYLCVSGFPMELYCDRHLHFNSETKRCELPCKAQCDTTLDCSSTEKPELSSSLPLTICREKDILPKPGHCEYYYDCTSGSRKKRKCPSGLKFNPTKRVCDLPQNAGCEGPIKKLPVPDLYYSCPCESCLEPSIYNCLDYFLCLNRTAYRMKCSDGLLYDIKLKTCNLANKVVCDGSTTTTQKPYTTSTSSSKTYTTSTSTSEPYSESSTTTTSKPYTTSTTTTSKPYTTSTTTTSKPYTTSTTTTSKPYTTSTTTTSKPYTTSTTTTSRPYTTSTTTTSKPYTTSNEPNTSVTPTPAYLKCPKPEGMFRNPKDCGSFIHCSNWRPYLQVCPSYLHFSVETQRCEYPCDAKCDNSLSCVGPSVPPPTPDPLCLCNNCLRPSSKSCTEYYECRDGKPYQKTCPWGKTFDSKNLWCDWSHRVNCQHSEICPRRNGLFPYKGDCKKFVHCANGIPYVKICPPRLQFHPATMRCTYVSGKCETSESQNATAGKSKPVAPQPQQWQCPNNFGYFRYEENCNKFYHCSQGAALLKECPKLLNFNTRTGTCDWQKYVNCRSDESRHQRSCRLYNDEVRCPLGRGYIAHHHCDMFYDCTTNRACAKRCPVGLYFNADTSTCDLPWNVNCRKRDGEYYSLKDFAEMCLNRNKGHVMDPANNSCFYKCQHKKVVRGCCSRNRVFNEQKNRCEWAISGPYF